jgi:pimeloyl-ACP methyl ester carboxylesterase
MLLTILIVLVFIFAFLYFVQDSMIFYRVHDRVSREFLQGRLGFREVMFTAENGKTYHGMIYYVGNEKAPLVIYFGGNGEVSYSHMSHRETFNQWPYFAGYHYLFVDYPGYGLNSGRTHYLNMYEQSLAVFDYAASLPNVDSSRIVAMGFSLGTGSAVYLAANRPVAGLIIIAPYANGYDLYNNVLPVFFGPMRLLVRQKLPSDKYAPRVTCPVLIIASRRDEMIPFSSSQRLSKLFQGQVDFMELYNERHNFIFQAEGIYERINFFLRELH